MEKSLFGKPSNILGVPTKELILRGSGLKFQQGSKFIDLLKNLNSSFDLNKIFKKATSLDSISENGIYLLEEKIVICIEGVKVTLESLITTYISYLEEQPEITSEQKQIALINSGFYYKTLKEAQDAKINSGVIFILENNSFYLAKEGNLTLYTLPEQIKTEEVLEESKKEVITTVQESSQSISTQDNIIVDGVYDENTGKFGCFLANTNRFEINDLVFIKKPKITISEVYDKEQEKFVFQLSEYCSNTVTIKYYKTDNTKLAEITIPAGALKSNGFNKTNEHSYWESDLEDKEEYIKAKVIGVDAALEVNSDIIYDIILDIKTNISLNNTKIIGGGSALLPPNTILLYYGKPPYGWVVCDGTNNTPNLTSPNNETKYIMKL